MTEGLLRGAGYAAALFSASAWAFGSILFRKLGDKASPIAMTLVKGVLGLFFIGVVLVFTGVVPMGTGAFMFLFLSGVLGIALGDTLFFAALMTIGPRLSILMGTLGPVFTVILAVVILGERPSSMDWAGMALVLGGVTWVMLEREKGTPPRSPEWKKGIIYGSLSALSISLSIIAAKVGVRDVPAIQATFVRVAGSTAALAVFGLVGGKLRGWIMPFRDIKVLRFTCVTVIVVMFGGFWMFLVSLKYIDASIASVLNSTTPVFILPMVVLAYKERISFRSVSGAVGAVAGVIMILVG